MHFFVFPNHFFFIGEGLRTVVKLVDRDTLLKEREEKRKVINMVHVVSHVFAFPLIIFSIIIILCMLYEMFSIF